MSLLSQEAINKNFGSVGIFYYYDGLVAYERQEYEEAVELLTKALSLIPGHQGAQAYLDLSSKAVERKNRGLPSEKEFSNEQRINSITQYIHFLTEKYDIQLF